LKRSDIIAEAYVTFLTVESYNLVKPFCSNYRDLLGIYARYECRLFGKSSMNPLLQEDVNNAGLIGIHH